MREETTPTRSQYKAVWSSLSDTLDRAKMHVIGSKEESDFEKTGRETLQILEETVGIFPGDIVLEIGCGIGRVGALVAPRCSRWIGCDVSAHMLRHAAERLRGFTNIDLRETNGYNLDGIAPESVTVVYCTVVFMHLESWDRYSYIMEAMRVLRPGGRIYVDNANLCSEGGWKVFEAHRAFPPQQRPPHITQCSTPQEIETYLTRAGFRDVKLRTTDDFVRAWAVKPATIND
ncbi:MAG: class I SAM-dependent methyltransferase [Chthoniobacterales bacterium]